MRFILLTFLLLTLPGHSEPLVYHDPALDTIANNIGYLDADLNGWMLHNGKPMNIADQTNYANLSLSNVVGNLTNNALAQRAIFTSAYSSAFGGSTGGPASSLSTVGIRTNAGVNASPSGSLISLGTFNGNSYSMDLKFTTGDFISPSFASLIRSVILGIVMSVLFVFSISAIQENIISTVQQRQVEGTKQSVFGINISAISAPIFAGIITAAISTLLPILAASSVVTTAYTASTAAIQFFGNANTFISAWDVLTSFCPIGEIFIAWINYVVFRYVYMFPLFQATRCVILFLGA